MGVLEITVEIAVINIILVIVTQLVSLEGLLVVTGSRNSSCALLLSHPLCFSVTESLAIFTRSHSLCADNNRVSATKIDLLAGCPHDIIV